MTTPIRSNPFAASLAAARKDGTITLAELKALAKNGLTANQKRTLENLAQKDPKAFGPQARKALGNILDGESSFEPAKPKPSTNPSPAPSPTETDILRLFGEAAKVAADGTIDTADAKQLVASATKLGTGGRDVMAYISKMYQSKVDAGAQQVFKEYFDRSYDPQHELDKKQTFDLVSSINRYLLRGDGYKIDRGEAESIVAGLRMNGVTDVERNAVRIVLDTTNRYPDRIPPDARAVFEAFLASS